MTTKASGLSSTISILSVKKALEKASISPKNTFSNIALRTIAKKSPVLKNNN